MSFNRQMKRNAKQAKKLEYKAKLKELRKKLYKPDDPYAYQVARDGLRKEYFPSPS